MLCLEVELLTGRYVAGRFGDRDRPEWPPHPARLYFALVAAWADEEPRSAAEEAVLDWLADQGAPEIASTESGDRRVVTHYVPVNDVAVIADISRVYSALVAADRARVEARADPDATTRLRDRTERAYARELARARVTSERGASKLGAPLKGVAILPEHRTRQARTFPTALPDEPRFWFVWPTADPDDEMRATVDGLAARVHRLGHSSSMVACRVSDEAPPGLPRRVPHAEGDEVLRVPAPGLLARLEEAWRHHQGNEPRVLPAALVAYRRAVRVPEPAAPAEPMLGEDWLVLARAEGPRLPLQRAPDLARRLRAALIEHADQPPARMLTGLAAEGVGGAARPSSRPHLAIAALPFVGHRHADGSLLGVALILPRDAEPDERLAVLRAVALWRRAGASLELGRAGAVRFELADPLDPRLGLRSATWCRPSRRWASVTPVALDRTPHHLHRGSPASRVRAWEEAEQTVASACEHAGLPRPAEVSLSTDGPITGVPPARAFPRHTARPGGLRRVAVHARLTFPARVRGPVLIGAGRYLGHGLCRPLDEDRS